MTNNDVLRRLRYILDLSDSRMMGLFGAAGKDVTRAQLSDWLKKDEDPAFQKCPDRQLIGFLDGLIVSRRGSSDLSDAKPESRITHNGVLRKLKIALALKAADMLTILATADVHISKHELSALFRNVEHKHYRACKSQFLRGFLKGLQLKYRGAVELEDTGTDTDASVSRVSEK